jgi:hypothetical protein
MGDEEWSMGNGEWEMVDGEWQMAEGQAFLESVAWRSLRRRGDGGVTTETQRARMGGLLS